MIKKVILFCVPFLISLGISAQGKDDFQLNILELNFPDGTAKIYEIKDNTFTGKTLIMQFNSKKNKTENKSKSIVKKKIKQDDLLKIKQISSELLSLDTLYSTDNLQVNKLIIDYKIDGKEKRIFLNNHSLKETNELFGILNKYIRKKDYHLPVNEPNN